VNGESTVCSSATKTTSTRSTTPAYSFCPAAPSPSRKSTEKLPPDASGLPGGVERAEVEDPVARADDLVSRPCRRVHAGDDEGGAVRSAFIPGWGWVMKDGLVRVGSSARRGPATLWSSRGPTRRQPYDLARFQATEAMNALNDSDHRCARAHRARISAVLARLRRHAVDEQAPAANRRDVRMARDCPRRPARARCRAADSEAELADAEPNGPWILLDVLGQTARWDRRREGGR